MEMTPNWFFWAILSAVFAALTAIFAKIGLEGVNSDLATLIRTVVIIVVLAGFNIGGVIYVGLALGILENFIVIFFPPEWMNSIAFVIMIGLMFWRPTGIFPEKVAENI